MKQIIMVLCLGCFDGGLISKAAYLGLQGDFIVHTLVTDAHNIDMAFSYGADQVDLVHGYDAVADDHAAAEWLEKKLNAEWKPDIILAPATIRLRTILPILAWRLQAGLTADCTELHMEENRLIQVRPAFGNNLMAWIKSTSVLQMATVRQGAFRKTEYKKEVRKVREYVMETQPTVKRISFTPFETSSPLTQADIILAGGMGIGSRSNFDLLAEMAQRIGAGLGASRMAVDAGFAPYSCQIGQTGVTVHPKLYIAVGISGAVQHLAGMSGAETVVAINQDPKAPIFQYADYGIVGDWKKIMMKFMET